MRVLNVLIASWLILGGFATLGCGTDASPPADRVSETDSGKTSAALSTTGTIIVLNKSEASASLFDRETGREIARVVTGFGPHEAAVSPDGKTAVVADYGEQTPGRTLSVIDLPARERTKVIDLRTYHRPHGIMYLPDGERVVVTAEVEQKLLIVNITTGEIEQALETDARGSHMVALSPDAKRAYVANITSHSMTAFDLVTGERLKVIPTGPQAEGIDVSPDGREVWVSNRAGNTVSIVNARTLEVEATLDSPAFPIRVKFTPDGRHVLVSNARSGDLAVFDAATRREVKRIDMKITEEELARDDGRMFADFGASPVPIGILIPPDGQQAFIANTNADLVTIVDLTTWEVVGRLRTGKQPDGMAWTPLMMIESE